MNGEWRPPLSPSPRARAVSASGRSKPAGLSSSPAAKRRSSHVVDGTSTAPEPVGPAWRKAAQSSPCAASLGAPDPALPSLRSSASRETRSRRGRWGQVRTSSMRRLPRRGAPPRPRQRPWLGPSPSASLLARGGTPRSCGRGRSGSPSGLYRPAAEPLQTTLPWSPVVRASLPHALPVAASGGPGVPPRARPPAAAPPQGRVGNSSLFGIATSGAAHAAFERRLLASASVPDQALRGRLVLRESMAGGRGGSVATSAVVAFVDQSEVSALCASRVLENAHGIYSYS